MKTLQAFKSLVLPHHMAQTVIVLVLQGEERARRSVLTEDGKLLTHYYSDALTLYEVFLRGIRESSQFCSLVVYVYQ